MSVSPKVETIGPLSFEVTADPAAAAVHPVAGIIPATLVEVPVSVTGEFPPPANAWSSRPPAAVRFESINTVGPVAVPEGTRVSTLDGIVFVTTDG